MKKLALCLAVPLIAFATASQAIDASGCGSFAFFSEESNMPESRFDNAQKRFFQALRSLQPNRLDAQSKAELLPAVAKLKAEIAALKASPEGKAEGKSNSLAARCEAASQALYGIAQSFSSLDSCYQRFGAVSDSLAYVEYEALLKEDLQNGIVKLSRIADDKFVGNENDFSRDSVRNAYDALLSSAAMGRTDFDAESGEFNALPEGSPLKPKLDVFMNLYAKVAEDSISELKAGKRNGDANKKLGEMRASFYQWQSFCQAERENLKTEKACAPFKGGKLFELYMKVAAKSREKQLALLETLEKAGWKESDCIVESQRLRQELTALAQLRQSLQNAMYNLKAVYSDQTIRVLVGKTSSSSPAIAEKLNALLKDLAAKSDELAQAAEAGDEAALKAKSVELQNAGDQLAALREEAQSEMLASRAKDAMKNTPPKRRDKIQKALSSYEEAFASASKQRKETRELQKRSQLLQFEVTECYRRQNELSHSLYSARNALEQALARDSRGEIRDAAKLLYEKDRKNSWPDWLWPF